MTACWPLMSKRSFFTHGSTAFLPSSSMATPSTVKPRGPYFCWNSISQGISTRQGPHHVAQKFTSTTLPLYCASVTSLPSRSLKVTSGAGTGVSAALTKGLPSFVDMRSTTIVSATNAARVAPTSKIFFMISCSLYQAKPGVRLPSESVQKPQFTRKPGQPVDENQPADQEQ